MVIEAHKITKENLFDAARWANEQSGRAVASVANLTEEKPFLFVYTLEGAMKCQVGDYLIKGVKGEFYPCKADIFEETYEKVYE